MKTYFRNESVSVVRNIPSYNHDCNYDLLRGKYKFEDDDTIFIYQGLLSESRGVDLILDAAINTSKKVSNGFKFVFFGYGPYEETLRKRIKGSQDIKFYGSVKQSDLLKYTASADVGVHGIKNTCLNHDYCLPNKVFEYTLSGIPIIVPDLVEMKKFILEHRVGITFLQDDQPSLEEAMLRLISDKALLAELKCNVESASKHLTWSEEYKVLKEIYAKL